MDIELASLKDIIDELEKRSVPFFLVACTQTNAKSQDIMATYNCSDGDLLHVLGAVERLKTNMILGFDCPSGEYSEDDYEEEDDETA